MECFFCGSEIKKIKQTLTIAGSKGPEDFPVNYECEKCIHVWLDKECAEDFRQKKYIRDYRNYISEAIRELCESKGGRLYNPLRLPDLYDLLLLLKQRKDHTTRMTWS